MLVLCQLNPYSQMDNAIVHKALRLNQTKRPLSQQPFSWVDPLHLIIQFDLQMVYANPHLIYHLLFANSLLCYSLFLLLQ